MNNDYDVINKFREFALDQGIGLPEQIVADGKTHRFRVEGEGKGKLSGSYRLHLDGRPAGFVQNFKTDEKPTKWKYTDPNYKKEPITLEKIKADAERKAEYALKAEAARKADIESKAQAAIRARKEWNNTKVSDKNPYAERKGIQLHNARVSEYKGEKQLIIPLQDKAGNFVSLQRVQADGTKRLFKEAKKEGAYSVLNKQPEPQIIAIAEGFATTASVIEDPYSVKNNIMGVMAVDAGNLKLVAEAMRELHPKAEILIFGDKGDVDGKGELTNKGEKAAIEAARVVNGYSVMPPIAKGDFNDYLTGKTGDITVSLENLINQSMGKVMANQEENNMLSGKNESEEFIKPTPFRVDYKQEGSNLVFSSYADNVVDAVKFAEEKGVGEIYEYVDDVTTYEGTMYKENNEWIHASGSPILTNEQKDDVENHISGTSVEAEQKPADSYYDRHEAFNAGEEAYSGTPVDYKIEDLPMALERPYRHDNIINKEQFMLGFMENATQENGFKSVEEAFKTRLPHLNADEYLNIALAMVDKTSGEHDYSDLPKLPLRDSIENSEMSFEVINRTDSDKLEVFTNASGAMERAVEVNAETIKIREQGQFTTEAWKNEEAEFVMPEGESFSKKYAVNTIENTTVTEQVIEPVVTESAQDQSTPAVEQTDPKTAQPISETVDGNYSDYVDDEFPSSSYDDFEPDYSTMPQDEDIDYEAHYAQQEKFAAAIMQDESRINQESKFYYQVEDTGVTSSHAITAQESGIKSNSEIIQYIDDNQVVAGVFHKNGNEYINKNPEPSTPDSLSQAQKENDFSHAVSIEIRAEQNLTLDRKTKSYPELDIKLAAVDAKEFFLIKGDEYKAQAQQSIAINAALSKDYINALPQEIIAKQSILDQIKQKAADLAETLKDKRSPKQSHSEKPEVKPVAPTSTTSATAEKVDISKPDIKTVEPENKPEPPKLIPKEVADKYLQVDDKFYFRKNKDVVIFEDKGVKLETKLNSPSVAVDLVRIASERNWQEIKITGTPEFKSEVWMEAESRGIATTGYKPTDIDRAMLKERLAKNPTNTIEEVKVLEKTNEQPSVRQMLDDSADKKIAEQHLKSRPELKETFEYLDALKKQLEKSGASERQVKAYMNTTKDGMAQMIEAGKYPEYQKTEHRQDARQDKQPVPQKTQAQKEVVVTKKKSKEMEMEL